MDKKQTTKPVAKKKEVPVVEEKVDIKVPETQENGSTKEITITDDTPKDITVSNDKLINFAVEPILPKEFTINYKKITTVKDVVLLLKGLGLKTMSIFESDIDEVVTELIAKKYIKEV